MRKTNTLRSHCPEHQTYPAEKMIPKGVMKWVREKVNVIEENGKAKLERVKRKRDKGHTSKFVKKTHNKRSRRFLKKGINQILEV